MHFKKSLKERALANNHFISYTIYIWLNLIALINQQLAGKEFIAGDSYSIADMACYPWIALHPRQQQNLADYPHLQRWLEALQNRPAIARVNALDEKISPAQRRKRYNMLSHKTKAILVSSIGGGLEMYDFTIYIFFAPIIAHHFFPHENAFLSLINTFAVFAIGYLSRPLGAVIFGHYGDSSGRKSGMLISIAIMGVATTLMGFLPTYASIGMLAPILLIILRFLQGIAVGGDLPGAMTFVAEHAPENRRGLSTSIVYCGVNLGTLLASLMGAVLSLLLSSQQLHAWGWRVGFILGAGIAVVGFYLRSRITETPYFTHIEQSKSLESIPIVPLLKHYSLRLLQGVGLVWLFGVVIALIFLYMPTYLSTEGHLNLKQALIINSIDILVFSCCIPLMGYLSDKIGRKPVLAIIMGLFIVLAFPIYSVLSHASLPLQIATLLVLSILSAGIVGVEPAVLTELFPTRIRYSGVAVAYNIGFAVFAGLTPMIVTYLLYKFHQPEAPSYYLILSAIIALIALSTIRETAKQRLDLESHIALFVMH